MFLISTITDAINSQVSNFTAHTLVQSQVTEAGSVGSTLLKSSGSQPHTLHHHLILPTSHFLEQASAQGCGTMVPIVYSIVPKPDAVIVLKVSTTRFAVWETPDETETTPENPESDAKGEESNTAGATISASSADHISRGDDEAALTTVPHSQTFQQASQVKPAGWLEWSLIRW
jgi:hypothetical protein